jgi:hypothetical protein
MSRSQQNDHVTKGAGQKLVLRYRSALRWSMSRTQIFEKGIVQKRTQLRATKSGG